MDGFNIKRNTSKLKESMANRKQKQDSEVRYLYLVFN